MIRSVIIGKGLEYTFFQRCTNGQQACETMLTITNNYWNASENHNEKPLHTIKMPIVKPQQKTNNKCWWECGKGEQCEA